MKRRREQIERVAVALLGVAFAIGVWHATSIRGLFGDRPLVLVRSSYAHAGDAIDVAAASMSIVVIPVDLDGVMLDTCMKSIDGMSQTLVADIVPTAWLCRRVAYEAKRMLVRLDAGGRVPLFVEGEEVRSIGLYPAAREWALRR